MKNTTSYGPNTGVKVVASLIAVSQIVSAAESTEKVETLEPTTVTATKFAKNLNDVSASVEVLDVEQLKREGNVSVQDAIGYRVPGVIVTSTSGQLGQPASLFIRGSKTNRSQVRLDGVRISGSDAALLDYLGSANLGGVSNIEILKGASSSAYGAGAIGGVVSISSDKGQGDPTTSVSAEYGSFDSWVGNLSSQGQVEELSYLLSLTAESTQNDSASALSGSDFEQLSYFLRLDYDLNDHSSVGLTVRGGDARYEIPEYGIPATGDPQENHYDSVFATLFYQNQVSEVWGTKLTLGRSVEDFDSLGGYGKYDTNTERTSVQFDNSFEWNDSHQTVVGFNYDNADYVTNYSTRKDRDTYGAFVNHAWSLTEDLQFNGALGWGSHEDYSTEWSWNTGLLWDVYDGWNVKANAGKAYRAPTFAELTPSPAVPASMWGPGRPAITVDSSIGGEQSINWDLGIEKHFDNTSVSVVWFENDINDSIQVVSNERQNVKGKTKINGLEVAFDTRFDDLGTNVFGSYTYYQTSETSEIPQQSATLGVNTELSDSLNVGVIATWIDERSPSFGTSVQLNDYLLVNLYTNYQLNKNVKLHARVENLLDDNYDLFADSFAVVPGAIKGRGRGFFGGVTVSF